MSDLKIDQRMIVNQAQQGEINVSYQNIILQGGVEGLWDILAHLPEPRLENLEALAIKVMFAKFSQSPQAVARFLGISPRGLYDKIKRYKMEANRGRPQPTIEDEHRGNKTALEVFHEKGE
jgi:DNA-binding NtrC family response regulator